MCAPGRRYHPAIIAQAAATLAEMYPDRIWLTVGSGERLNEGITGGGGDSQRPGLVSAEHARLYVRPDRPPLVFAAALSAETARWAATWADGLVTAAGPIDAMQAVVDAFRAGGGGSKPMFLQVALSFAPTEGEALAAAMDQWRHAGLPSGSLAELATPDEFDAAAARVGPEQLRRSVRVSTDVRRHIEWLKADRALGFERIYLHNVARDHQEWFIDVFGEEVLPEFRPD